mmetsp:Transcript_2591/g.8933  ORF Transcript_2591/g.8933 Transcript_2591/m.8933 type:complete len:123 (-) Transcript_2591:83-451(-)
MSRPAMCSNSCASALLPPLGRARAGPGPATGWGEAIATCLSSARAVDLAGALEAPDAADVVEACEAVLRELHVGVANPRGQGATGGVIVLSSTGAGGWAFTTPRMARGGWAEGGDPWVALDR